MLDEMKDGKGRLINHLFFRGRQFDINHDGLIGKSMIMKNGNSSSYYTITLKNDDGTVSQEYPYSPQNDPTQTVKIIAFRIGSANDTFPSLWLKGNVITQHNATGAPYWVEAKLITIL